MDAGVTSRHGETAQHARLKRLRIYLGASARIFRLRHGSDFAPMPISRRRGRLSAVPKQTGSTAVFECKQALCDLRRDNCRSESARERLEAICKRRQILENHLRIHYPNLHIGDSLFPEFDSQDFSAIGHRGYARVIRELRTLQNRLYDCTKFEKLVRYRCANLFFIVLPEQLFRESEMPVGWGALAESNDTLTFVRKPVWHDATAANRLHVLHRIAVAGTRNLNRELSLDWHEQIVPGHFFRLRQAEQK